MTTTIHQCIILATTTTTITLMAYKEKCCKLHTKLNLKNKKKDNKKNNLMGIDSRNQVEISSDVDDNSIFTSFYKEVNLISIQQ